MSEVSRYLYTFKNVVVDINRRSEQQSRVSVLLILQKVNLLDLRQAIIYCLVETPFLSLICCVHATGLNSDGEHKLVPVKYSFV